MEAGTRLLVIDDSKSDVFLIREALAAAGVRAGIDVVHDGQAALQFLNEEARPALVLLDLNIPKHSGQEILRHIRSNVRTKDLPVLVVTSSALSRDREELTALGFEAYFQKPSNYEAFLKLGPLVEGLLERGN